MAGSLFWLQRPQARSFDVAPRASSQEPAEYIGSDRCTSCHLEQATDHAQSHHGKSWLVADATTINGAFDGQPLINGTREALPLIDAEGVYRFRIEDSQDTTIEPQVRWVIGIYPLEQYVVQFDDGRMQVLPWCWDSRTLTDGGQRWFHLYGDEAIVPTDPLHWSRHYFTANSMCMDCHVSGVEKGYDAARNTFNTSWREGFVGCESCHGPGSNHSNWAAYPDPAVTHKGLTIPINTARLNWVINPDTGIAHTKQTRKNDIEIDRCARCHTRRGSMSGDVMDGDLFDTIHPELLRSPLYHADGRIQDEDFEWGSFTQSKMYHAGVTCSDCHQPHSAKLRAEGDNLCFLCHDVNRFAQTTHHHHPQESAGARCVACHMPTSTSMQVHVRHDHRFSIPRPDLTAAHPQALRDACTDCHQDQSPEWAAAATTSWYGTPDLTPSTFGPTGHRSGRSDKAPQALIAQHPDFVQGTQIVTERQTAAPQP